MKPTLYSISAIAFLLALATTGMADVKVRQKMTMSGQTFETTKMIKGSRQRAEQKMDASLGAADFMSQVATVTQCDLRRTVQVNDRKKVYFIEPFAEAGQTPTEAAAAAPKTGNKRRGGTMTMMVSVKDTGERQTLFGLTARHLIIVQEIETSADSCNGASRSKMEIDGWYVDFSADFNCPYEIPQTPPPTSAKPDCIDRVITKSSGGSAGNAGFLLNGTMKFYDAGGKAQMTQTIETLELSRASLADSLFNIPQDYKLVSSQQELYSMPSVADMMRQQSNGEAEEQNVNRAGQNNPPASPGAKTVGLNITVSSNAKVNQSEISQYVQNKLRENDLNARQGATGEGLDYVLNVEVKQVKESAAGKVGGLFGKVTGVETKAGKVEVELVLTLTAPNSTAPIAQSRVSQKFDGTAREALQAAIDQAMDKILSEIDN